LPKTADRTAEQFDGPDPPETKKEQGGDRRSEDFSRANNLPLKSAERIAEQSTSLTGRETKKERGGDRGNQYTVARANNLPLPKTAERIAEQFNVSHQTVKNAEKFADAVDAIADTYGDEAGPQHIATFQEPPRPEYAAYYP